MSRSIPKEVLNWINNEPCPAQSGQWFDKYKPADGKLLCRVARSGAADVKKAVVAAEIVALETGKNFFLLEYLAEMDADKREELVTYPKAFVEGTREIWMVNTIV